MLLDYDEHNRSATYKFGVILQKKRQVTEEEMFNNCVVAVEEEFTSGTDVNAATATIVAEFTPSDEEERRDAPTSPGRRSNASGFEGEGGNGSLGGSASSRGASPTAFNHYNIGRTKNSDGRALTRFMNLIADRVKLEGFQGKRGLVSGSRVFDSLYLSKRVTTYCSGYRMRPFTAFSSHSSFSETLLGSSLRTYETTQGKFSLS